MAFYRLVRDVLSDDLFILKDFEVFKEVHSLSEGRRLLPILNSMGTKPSLNPRVEWENKFTDLYSIYPRKIGKNQGINKLVKEILKSKDKETYYNDFKNTLERFISECKKQELESKFIPHFSTFCSKWQDYMEEFKSKKEKDLTKFEVRHFTVQV